MTAIAIKFLHNDNDRDDELNHDRDYDRNHNSDGDRGHKAQH